MKIHLFLCCPCLLCSFTTGLPVHIFYKKGRVASNPPNNFLTFLQWTDKCSGMSVWESEGGQQGQGQKLYISPDIRQCNPPGFQIPPGKPPVGFSKTLHGYCSFFVFEAPQKQSVTVRIGYVYFLCWANPTHEATSNMWKKDVIGSDAATQSQSAKKVVMQETLNPKP